MIIPSERLIIYIIVAVSIMVTLIIWFGFNSQMANIVSCETTVSKYVLAEFSETSTGVCYDSEGDTYTCVNVDHWDEPASEVYTVKTINGKITYQSHGFDIVSSFYPPMPLHDRTFNNEPFFHGFNKKTKGKLVTTVNMSGELETFDDPISKASQCLLKLESFVVIKTWYGIAYSSEF